MILDVLKNNFEKKGEPFYSNKMRTSIEKQNKKKKKKKKKNFSFQDENEKDSTKVESTDDANSLTENEAHSKSEPSSGGKEDSLLQNAKGRNAPLKTTTTTMNKKKKKKKKKNASKGLYPNVKGKNTNYEENEKEDFTEDIFENENFDELQFVEDENVEYRTYNSFSNAGFKLLSKYSVDDAKEEFTKRKKKKKRQGQEEQKGQGSYEKYNFNHEESFKGNHNEFDSDIIKFLNRNKKSIDYDKRNGRPFQKEDAYSYDASERYGGKRGKQKQLHDIREDKDNYEHYREENADYYDREEDQNGDDQSGEDQNSDDQSNDDQSNDDQSGGSQSNDDYNTSASQYKYQRSGGVNGSGKFKGGGSLGQEDDEDDEEEEGEEDEEEEEGEEDEEEEEDDGDDDNYDDENDGDPLDQEEETNTEDPSCRPPLASEFKYQNIPAGGHIYDKREDSYFENDENTWNATKYNPTERTYGGEKRHEINLRHSGRRGEENPKVEYLEKTKNKKSVNINVSENNLKKSSTPYGRQYNIQRSAMEGKSSLRNALNIGNPNLSKDKYKFNLPNGEDKLIKFNIGAYTINNNRSKPIHKEERISAFDYMLHSSNLSVHAGTNDYFLKRGAAEQAEQIENDYTDSHFSQAGQILQPLREETQKAQKDPHGEEKKKHNIKSFLDKIKHRKNNEDMLKREHSKYDHAERSDKKDKFKMKFTDILHGRTLGNFFHRNKSSAAKSLSPQRERDASVEPCIQSNGVEKFGWLHGGRSNTKRNDQLPLHQKTTLAEPPMIKDEMEHYSAGGAVKIMDTFSNQEKAINDGTIMQSGRRVYDKRGSKNTPEFSYKGGSSPKEPISSKVGPVTWDGRKNDIGKTSDRNKRNPKLEDSKGISSNDIMSGKYSRKYDASRHDLDADTDRKVPGGENITHSIYQQFYYRNPLGNENRIVQFEGDPKRGRQITLQGGNGRDEESDVKMEQTLNRKMIENNELKKRNENNEEVLATPFYIKSKIDKVLKNSEIFERSARATFQQFDVKNKNFLHFSEIESLIQKLCFNLELPPVDKNILSIVYKDYDSSKNNSMNYTDFRQMYWDLLKQIKKKYYPTKNLKIKRNCIISRKKLGGYDYSSIYNYLSFKKILGCGAFGEVHLVEDNICKLYKVVKILKKKKLKNIKINEEINVLIYLDHPNIIKIFDVYENVDCTYIVMELCEGGELMDKIIKSSIFNEEYIKNIMFQILCAIAYMHSNNIAHKDLKPENILFKSKGDDTLKIIDFGLAELINHTEGVSKTAAGTVLYMAPEVFKKKFTIKCDIWSAGVIMFFLFSKNLPFCGNTYDEIKLSIFKDEPDYKSLKGRLSQPGLHILKLMLEKDHTRRPMAAVVGARGYLQAYFYNITTKRVKYYNHM